ncbi:SHOCT domain-containing protein [Natronorubrum sp. JWXQ-INN-674]|uniref:SHOCT domain-containing protein n=1 Tax=Natronorubrum halalkaliphilum TaxID=2691917 RepID=A0A6B0VQ26_9EURY|nr:SHOCT domain-containing protein [Natronorubrum halalkaliphilum]MXV63574.1 SHOCT domain-containing protein [Natronorubrum halalkaliphilum]
MAEERPVIRVSTPAVAVTVVALLGTLVTLATLQSPVAILLVIFGFIFGDNLLRHVTTAIDDNSAESMAERESAAKAEPGDPEDALERLRVRYADGELSETEFERRLEVLLETETVADVERYLEDDGDRANGRERKTEPEPKPDRELERSSG